MSSFQRYVIPKFRHQKKRLEDVIIPAKMPVFRSVVGHPSPAYDAKARDNQNPTIGPHTMSFTTNPKAYVPLTFSPTNHLIWNPPARNSKTNRRVELDSSGRLSKFAERYAGMGANLEQMMSGGETPAASASPFDLESLSAFEGKTAQSTGQAADAKMLKKPSKAKKGKK